MRAYSGFRNPRTGAAQVTIVNTRSRHTRGLARRLDLSNHSPTGFEWGYNGSGPAQLALAMLADYVGDDAALALYQDFKRDVIAGLGENWSISGAFIDGWLAGQRAKAAA